MAQTWKKNNSIIQHTPIHEHFKPKTSNHWTSNQPTASHHKITCYNATHQHAHECTRRPPHALPTNLACQKHISKSAESMTETHGTRTHTCCQNNDLTKMPTTPRNRQKHPNPNNHHRTPVFPQTTNFSKYERKCSEKMDTHGYDGRFLEATHDKKRLANREHNMQNELEPNHVPRTSASS